METLDTTWNKREKKQSGHKKYLTGHLEEEITALYLLFKIIWEFCTMCSFFFDRLVMLLSARPSATCSSASMASMCRPSTIPLSHEAQSDFVVPPPPTTHRPWWKSLWSTWWKCGKPMAWSSSSPSSHGCARVAPRRSPLSRSSPSRLCVCDLTAPTAHCRLSLARLSPLPSPRAQTVWSRPCMSWTAFVCSSLLACIPPSPLPFLSSPDWDFSKHEFLGM